MFWSLVPASWSTLFSWPLSPNTCLFFFLLLWLLLHRFSLSAHPLNISVFRILAHFHSIQLPWVILSTPMLMTLKYIFLFLMVFLNISSLSNGTANLTKTELIFSPYLYPSKAGPPLVFPPSLNGTTGHRVAEVKNLLVFLTVSLYPSSSSWAQPPCSLDLLNISGVHPVLSTPLWLP